MQKQQLIGIIVISFVLFLYMAVIFPKYYSQPVQPEQVATTSQDTTLTPQGVDTTGIVVPTQTVTPTGLPTETGIALSTTTQSLDTAILAKVQEVVVDSDLYRAKFTTLGARLTSFHLKKISVEKLAGKEILEKNLADAERAKNEIQAVLIRAELAKIRNQEEFVKLAEEAMVQGDGEKADEYMDKSRELDWVELVTENHQLTKPFQMSFSGVSQADEVTLYHPSTTSIRFSGDTGVKTISFTGQLNNGLVVEKTFDFTNDNYVIDFGFRLYNPTERMIRLSDNDIGLRIYAGTGIGELQMHSQSRYDIGVQSIIKFGKKVKTIKLNAKNPEVKQTGDIKWASIQTNYFFKGFILPEFSLVTSATYKNTPVAKTYAPTLWLEMPSVDIPVQYESKQSLLFYIGPKQAENLAALQVPVEEIIFPGWLQFINLWMLKLLKWFYAVSKNYGVAIIFLSVLLKLVTFPLTHISFKSMKRMQMLAPEMKILQEKYKDDPTRQQKEMMGLYKKHKVNPMSGCLPLLIQMPIFISLYSVLGKVIELRNAPFIWWIQDLSKPDTIGYIFGFSINILPLLMGATMWLQQKMTTTPDPKSAMISQLMTVFFLFIFWNMPSGLVLYWFITNILSILQQHYINKQEIPVHLPHATEKK